MKYLSRVSASSRRLAIPVQVTLSMAIALPMLTGCNSSSSSGSSAEGPQVNAVYSRYRTNAPEYSEFRGNDFTSTLQLYVDVDLQGDHDAEDIEKIRIWIPDSEFWQTIHDTGVDEDSDDFRDNYVSSHGYFSSTNYFRTTEGLEHRRPIEGYRVEVTDSSGARTRESFSLTIPEGLGTGQETFFYDKSFDGETADGLQGLRGADVDITHIDNDSVQFNVSTLEDRATEIILTFNKIENGDNEYIGFSRGVESGADGFQADGGDSQIQLDVSDDQDFTYSNQSDLLLEDATHFKVVIYGPNLEVDFVEGSTDLMPFLYWSGYTELD